jgi:hypothetical protein
VLEGPAISVEAVLQVIGGFHWRECASEWACNNMGVAKYVKSVLFTNRNRKKMHKTNQRWGLSLTQIWRFEQLHRWTTPATNSPTETDRRIIGDLSV